MFKHLNNKFHNSLDKNEKKLALFLSVFIIFNSLFFYVLNKINNQDNELILIFCYIVFIIIPIVTSRINYLNGNND
jgi:uncharacterized membrane protein